jgi:hypothetical protein
MRAMSRYFVRTSYPVALMAVALVFTMSSPASAQRAPASADRDAVRQAVLDYVEGVYQAQPERIQKSVSPELAKLGLYRAANDTGQYRAMGMTFTQLVGVATNYSRNNKIPADAPKRIDVYDVLDKTASVKLTALWGSDYMLLAKQPDGRWLITHVLWQSPPR